jgi:hypothetical protein
MSEGNLVGLFKLKDLKSVFFLLLFLLLMLQLKSSLLLPLLTPELKPSVHKYLLENDGRGLPER